MGSRPGVRTAGTAGRIRSGGAATTGATVADTFESRVSRSRGTRGVTGYAQPREFSGGSGGSFVYPWYSFGFGYGGYDPWRYGSSRYWARYGGWYDPFGYSLYGPYGYGRYGYGPFGYDPYGHFYGAYYWGSPYALGGGGGGGGRDDYDDDRELGSIRLRANPREARVYIDGALAGIVDDFDGLSNHLKLEPGKHQLELRADGYEPYSAEIDVKAGRTRTERAELKRRN